MKKRVLSILLIMFIFVNTTFTCYATEVISTFLTWSNLADKIKEIKDMSKEDILMSFYTTLRVASGSVSGNKEMDRQAMDYWIDYFFGEDVKKVSDMTVDELDALLETYYGKMNKKNSGYNTDGRLILSDELITDFRNWLNKYMSGSDTPLYYMTLIPSVDDLTVQNCTLNCVLNTIKNAIEAFGTIAVQYNSVNKTLKIVYFNTNQYFYIYYQKYTSYGQTEIIANLYDANTEKSCYLPYFSIQFGDDLTAVSDFQNDYRITSKGTTSGRIFFNYPAYQSNIQVSYGNSANAWVIPSATNFMIVSDEKEYIKVYSTLSNYQKCINDRADKDIYYTTNYFKTTNIQESPVDLEMMINLYEAYDDLCKKVVQFAQDTQNCTDTMLMNKLDELIKAVYENSGNGDITIDTDMSTTNTILNKISKKIDDILQAIKAIGNIEIIDLGEDNPITEWTNNITNMVVNPEANIDATIGDISGSMDEPITLLKTKFPFSIPWDIAFLLEFLADSPETPKFEIPMKFESMNIDEKLTIDFSHFESVSKVSRMLLTLLFMVALMNLTTKVFNIGGASND